MSSIFVYLLTIVFLYCIHCIQQYFRVWRYIKKIPGPKAYPIIGTVLDLGFKADEYLDKLLKFWYEFGCDKFSVWILQKPYVVISDPKDIEIVLSTLPIHSKADYYKQTKQVIGDGLITAEVAKWQKHRKMINPLFNLKMMIGFLKVMNRQGNILVDNFQKYSKTEEIFNVQHMISSYILEVFCETAFGVPMLSMKNNYSDILKSFEIVSEIIQQRTFSVFKRADFIFKLSSDWRKQEKEMKTVTQFIVEIIETRRKPSEKNENSQENGEPKAFLDNLLIAEIDGKSLTFQEIFDEVLTFLAAGHETTNSATCFTLYTISRFPDIQEKIFEEQKQIFGDDIKRDATYNDIQDMLYLDLVIKETLRIFPSVPIIGRAVKEPYKLGDLIIPPSSTILLLIFAMGRNEKYFKDPMKFDPNRFDKDNCENRNKFDWIPFSAGPRNCIGKKYAMMAIKSVISNIIRNYEILPPYEKCCNETKTHNHDALDQKLDPPLLTLTITLNSSNGINIRLRSRNSL